MNIGILLFDDVEVLDFCGPFEVFSVAAGLGAGSGGESPFTVFTLAERAGLVRAAGGLKVQPDYTIDDIPSTTIHRSICCSCPAAGVPAAKSITPG